MRHCCLRISERKRACKSARERKWRYFSILLARNLERFKTLAGSIALFPFIGTCDASRENTLQYTDWSVWREHVELSTVKVRSGRAHCNEQMHARVHLTDCVTARTPLHGYGIMTVPTIFVRSSALFRPERHTWDSSLSKLGINCFRPSVARLSTKFKRYTVTIEFLRIKIRRKGFFTWKCIARENAIQRVVALLFRWILMNFNVKINGEYVTSLKCFLR